MRYRIITSSKHIGQVVCFNVIKVVHEVSQRKPMALCEVILFNIYPSQAIAHA
jgi:hypothetical protein